MRRTREDAEKTRLQVIEAALKLFSRQGYSRTTLHMIAEEAGFSRGPIYWHFRNKDELFEAVLQYSQEPLQQLVELGRKEKDPLLAIGNFIDSWFALLAEDKWYRQSFEILLNKTELTEAMATTLKRERRLTREIIAMLAQRLEDAARNNQARLRDSAEPLALLGYTYLMGITQSWLFAPRLFSLSEQAPFFRRRLLMLLDLDAG